ncbi:hypothetical protein HYT58_02040, partial [Candidatus Woesearchaeota archaeon]|nr:hypothetical protein [Candidatus Woesearchaeota archaeon]
GTFNNNTWRDITTKYNCFCNNLSFVDTIDRANFTVNLFVPADTAAATYTDSLLSFVASSTVGAQHAGGDCDGLADS